MDRLWTTADVPPQYLQTVMLVGDVPRRALTSDRRLSYSLYVPKDHYNPDPSKHTMGELARPKLPLLVFIHGTKRDVSSPQRDLVAFADATPCAILIPLFPAGLDGPSDLDSYKRLRSATLRSDLALLSMLEEVAHGWPGIETNRVFLMGFSGGGQFAHRFLYLYPERLAAVGVGSPGRITLLDDQHNWPLGVADVERLFERRIESARIAQVHIQLVVGSKDNYIPGGEGFWAWLAQAKARHKDESGAAKDKAVGELPPFSKGRLDTLKGLQEALQDNGIEAKLEIVEGVDHQGSGVRENMLRSLQPLIRNSKERSSD